MPDATTYVQKKQTTILCKMKDQAIGLEIVEMAKAPNSPHPLIRAEGGVLLRFFCSTQPEATWVRMCLGPWEASELAAKIQTALDTKDKVEFTLAPHKFIRRTKDDKQGEEILTTWTIERWVREQNQAGAEHPAAGVPVRRRSPARPGRRGAGHRPPHAAPRGRRECGLAVRGHRDGSGRPRAPRPGDRPLVRKRSRCAEADCRPNQVTARHVKRLMGTGVPGHDAFTPYPGCSEAIWQLRAGLHLIQALAADCEGRRSAGGLQGLLDDIADFCRGALHGKTVYPRSHSLLRARTPIQPD